MRRINLSAFVLLSVLGAVGTQADGSPVGALSGHISSTSKPLASAAVYAYQIADLTMRKGMTDAAGNFLFEALPAGIYKIIAAKPGFAPAVVLLTRRTAQARQFIAVDLRESSDGEDARSQDFWTTRQQIPSDVLRDLEGVTFASSPEPISSRRPAFEGLHAKMKAVAGTEEHANLGASQLTGGEVDVTGEFKDMRIGLSGNFRELQGAATSGTGAKLSTGNSRAISLDFQHSRDGRLRLTSLDNKLVSHQAGAVDSINLESHKVAWSSAIGNRSHTNISAQYTSERNFYRQGLIDVADLPYSTRAWNIEGSLTTAPSRHTTLQTGFRIRERQSGYADGLAPSDSSPTLLPEERIELFGLGGLQINPAMLVEYGLFSAMKDGSLSLAPRGGLVVNLGENWQASTSMSRLIRQRETLFVQDFSPALLSDLESCDQNEEYCYKILLTRSLDDDNSLSFGAINRKFAETLRLYFQEDFFDHLESLYFVPGDRLPELQLGLTRRMREGILVRFESHLARGGGGVLRTTDDSSYENEIRYLVTSIDTRFEKSSTGVFIAFHHLEQRLNPLEDSEVAAIAHQVDFERLQLRLTQDLNVISMLTSNLALQLNMELSRGAAPGVALYAADDLRKRITGGVTLRF